MRNQIILYNRPVVVKSVAGNCLEDAYIESAYFDDFEECIDPLTETELESLTCMYPETVAEMWLQNAIERAESQAEGMER